MVPEHFDLTGLKPVGKNNTYELYLLGFINEQIRKGILVDIKTKEQLQCRVEILNKDNKIYYKVIEYMDPIAYMNIKVNYMFTQKTL